MAYSVTGRNTAVDAVAALGHWMSLHTADPGTTGASEGAGVTRAQATFPAASAGSSTAPPVGIAVPAGTYTHWGAWSASSGGTFVTGGALPAPVTFPGPGTYNLTVTDSA